MKVFISGDFHHKNKHSLITGLKQLGVQFVNNINEANLIYSPDKPINIEKYPNKKFIFGPHFSVKPDKKSQMNNKHKNAIYIQPSEWVRSLWVDEFKYNSLPLKVYPFGVDTDGFVETKPIEKRDKVFIYYKRRKKSDLNHVQSILDSKKIRYRIFEYGSYQEQDYLNYLREAKYGIWLGTHESQGFAVQEAMSCNVPLLVWNVTRMYQEEGQYKNYCNINTKATTVTTWNEKCGLTFEKKEDFTKTLEKFLGMVNGFRPRDIIVDKLTIKKRAEEFLSLI